MNHKEEGQWGKEELERAVRRWDDRTCVCSEVSGGEGKRSLLQWQPSPNHAKWSEKKKDQREKGNPAWVKSGTIDCITSITDEVDVKFGETELSSGNTEAEVPIAWPSIKDSKAWKFCYSWGEPHYCGNIITTISQGIKNVLLSWHITRGGGCRFVRKGNGWRPWSGATLNKARSTSTKEADGASFQLSWCHTRQARVLLSTL